MPSEMKKRVVLIQPKNTLALNIYPPLNLVLIGSALEQKGYEVKIVTCPTVENHMDVIIKECRDVLFAGIGVLTPEVPYAIEIAKGIKKEVNIPLVWGGWHATLFPEQMAASNLVDKVIVDEGDRSILQVADNYFKNDYRDNHQNKIVRDEKKLSMDELCCPNYSLVPNIEVYINSILTDKFMEYDTRNVRWLPYQASRGCPGLCTFCINVVTDNRKYRKKNAEKVVDEMQAIVQKLNINHLKIIDDNLFVKVEWIKDIAKRLIEKKLDITWDAECRVNYFNEKDINDQCLELLIESGMNQLTFGIESGSQKSLDIMKKGITPEQSLNTVKKCSKLGIVARCSFIIDIPGEEKKDIFKTVRLINEVRKLPKTMCGVMTYRPYPKSELSENMLKQGIIEQPLSFEGWGRQKYIEQFTYADAKRKWQSNYKLSSKISYYQNAESSFWIASHQISSKLIKKMNNFFVKMAKKRNTRLFYHFEIDRYLYNLFRFLFYKFK